MDGKFPLSKITLNKRTNSGTKTSLNVIKYSLSKLSLPADFLDFKFAITAWTSFSVIG